MIFEVFQITQKAREAHRDPQGFANSQAKGALIGALAGPIVTLLIFLAFLGVLSYTHFLGGPYSVARFFFWFLIVIYGTIAYMGYLLYRSIKRALERQKKAMRKAAPDEGGNYREAEVIE